MASQHELDPVTQPRDARPDFGRAARKGIPEIVLAGPKSDGQVVEIVRAFLTRTGRALVSRLRPGMANLLAASFVDCQLEVRGDGRIAVLRAPGAARPQTGGRIGILSAGTSDVPMAEEARLVAEEMGCEVATLYDVGVAGLHRLLGPLSNLLDEGVDALVVAAGMDGALPSVVAGLAPVPVIGLPTSVGYGAGGRGRAALLSMLQTCAPGLAVVNIDNGVGAGAMAALIANRAAAARGGAPPAQHAAHDLPDLPEMPVARATRDAAAASTSPISPTSPDLPEAEDSDAAAPFSPSVQPV